MNYSIFLSFRNCVYKFICKEILPSKSPVKVYQECLIPDMSKITTENYKALIFAYFFGFIRGGNNTNNSDLVNNDKLENMHYYINKYFGNTNYETYEKFVYNILEKNIYLFPRMILKKIKDFTSKGGVGVNERIFTTYNNTNNNDNMFCSNNCISDNDMYVDTYKEADQYKDQYKDQYNNHLLMPTSTTSNKSKNSSIGIETNLENSKHLDTKLINNLKFEKQEYHTTSSSNYLNTSEEIIFDNYFFKCFEFLIKEKYTLLAVDYYHKKVYGKRIKRLLKKFNIMNDPNNLRKYKNKKEEETAYTDTDTNNYTPFRRAIYLDKYLDCFKLRGKVNKLVITSSINKNKNNT